MRLMIFRVYKINEDGKSKHNLKLLNFIDLWPRFCIFSISVDIFNLSILEGISSTFSNGSTDCICYSHLPT